MKLCSSLLGAKHGISKVEVNVVEPLGVLRHRNKARIRLVDNRLDVGCLKTGKGRHESKASTDLKDAFAGLNT